MEKEGGWGGKSAFLVIRGKYMCEGMIIIIDSMKVRVRRKAVAKSITD